MLHENIISTILSKRKENVLVECGANNYFSLKRCKRITNDYMKNKFKWAMKS